MGKILAIVCLICFIEYLIHKIHTWYKYKRVPLSADKDLHKLNYYIYIYKLKLKYILKNADYIDSVDVNKIIESGNLEILYFYDKSIEKYINYIINFIKTHNYSFEYYLKNHINIPIEFISGLKNKEV